MFQLTQRLAQGMLVAGLFLLPFNLSADRRSAHYDHAWRGTTSRQFVNPSYTSNHYTVNNYDWNARRNWDHHYDRYYYYNNYYYNPYYYPSAYAYPYPGPYYYDYNYGYPTYTYPYYDSGVNAGLYFQIGN